MKNAVITTENFFIATITNFTKIAAAPDRAPDFKSGFGSEYWYENGNVIRRSDHWGIVASCTWMLNGNGGNRCKQVGTCPLADFEPVPMGLSSDANEGLIAKKMANPKYKFFKVIGRYTFFCANEDHPVWSALAAANAQDRFRKMINIATKNAA